MIKCRLCASPLSSFCVKRERGRERERESERREMGMKEALPFLGMVSIQFIQVGMIVAVKEATSHGLTKFTFVFYSNSLAALILLPTSFLLHSLLGCTSQVVGNVAVQITPASFSTAIMNLVPGFTFTLAVIFRLEQADFKSSSTLAKSIGTIISIVGALIVTLYKGPSLLMTATQYNLVLGAFLLTIECLSSSAYIITQAFLLTEFGAELIIVFFFSFFVAIMTGILSLVMERDPAAWSLLPSVKLLSILFSGIVGSSIQASILLWCLRQRGPLFTAVFPPLGIVISTVVGIIIFGDILYLGSVVGSIIIVIGFYSVMWGKSKEQKVITDDEETSLESPREKAPLLQNIRETQGLQGKAGILGAAIVGMGFYTVMWGQIKADETHIDHHHHDGTMDSSEDKVPLLEGDSQV
ncbi:unnamed protein product [Camellia sinensis]